jgi:D-inositol-3-phosphate glycosyltransferase
MKIIQVQTQAEAAGAQRVSDMVGAGLRDSGHEVRTVFMYRKTNAYDDDPHVDFVRDNPPEGFIDQVRAAYGLVRYVMQQKPDAVITYQYWGNLFGTIGGRLARAKKIIINQSGRPLTKGLLGLVCRFEEQMGVWGWFDYSVVNSDWTLKQFDDYPEEYRQRIRLIEHGVAGPEKKYDQVEARHNFRLPQNVRLIVTTGRQTEDKNQGVLLAALPFLSGVHLAIAGVGPLHDELLAEAVRLGVRGRLHMVGEVAPRRIYEFLATGDLFGFASLDETFGLSVVEAAIAGLPVVSYDLPVLREVLKDSAERQAALFVSPAEGGVFAQAIKRVLADKELREKLTKAGRGLANKYHPLTMCMAYEELLLA